MTESPPGSRVVVALGGNALLRRGEVPTAEVQRRNLQAAADVLAELLGDFDQRVRLSRGARALIDAQFDVRKNTARIRDLFEATGGA